MRFLADENIASSVVVLLRTHAHDVFDVKEKKWFGRPDSFLLRFAAKQKRIILTHDKDFLYQEKVPVLLLRFSNQQPAHIGAYLLSFLKMPQAKQLRDPGIVILSEYGAEFHKPFGL